jgi:hypothetical protein
MSRQFELTGAKWRDKTLCAVFHSSFFNGRAISQSNAEERVVYGVVQNPGLERWSRKMRESHAKQEHDLSDLAHNCTDKVVGILNAYCAVTVIEHYKRLNQTK